MIISAAVLFRGKLYVDICHAFCRRQIQKEIGEDVQLNLAETTDLFIDDKGNALTRREAADEAIVCRQVTNEKTLDDIFERGMDSVYVPRKDFDLVMAQRFADEFNSRRHKTKHEQQTVPRVIEQGV